MIVQTSVRLVIALWLVAGGCTTTVSQPPNPPAGPPIISLEKPVHFVGADGSDAVVSPGFYMVRQQGEAQLALIPAEGNQPIIIQAILTSYDEQLPVQVLSGASSEDAHHVILSLPERKALEAVGSYTGVRPRLVISPTKSQLDPLRVYCIWAPCIRTVSPASITFDTVVTITGQNLASVRPESEASPTNSSWAAFVKLSDSAGLYGEQVFLEVRDFRNSPDGTKITFRVGGPVWWHPGTYVYRSVYYDESLSTPSDRFRPLSPAPTTWSGKLRFRNPSVQSTPNDNYYSLAGPQRITWTKSSP